MAGSCVLFSGGLDSAVLLALERRDHERVHPVHVRSGLAWEDAERRAIDRLLASPAFATGLAPLTTLSVDMRDVYPATHWAITGNPPSYDTPDEDVYLDGRKPTAKHLDDPTYAGYSTGHWEGDTLVVETVALHPDSFIEGFTPHSDAMTVSERIRFTSPGILEDRITVRDPKALTEPWQTVRTYRKALPPNDELREFACAEGLGRELFKKP